MRAIISIEIELDADRTIIDAAEIAQHATALLLLNRDRRLETAQPAGAERVDPRQRRE